MVNSRILLFFVLLAAFAISCNNNETREADTSSIQMELVSENLDAALFSCKSVEDVQSFLQKYNYLQKAYFTDFPGDSAQLASHLFNILQNPDLQRFRKDLDTLIGDRKATVLTPLLKAYKQIKYHYPAFNAPKVQFIITGFEGNDLYVSDSLVIIGLDYFGGPQARYRPDVYDYQLRRYRKEYIVPSIVFFTSNRYNRMNAQDQTLLADMIGYGKAYEFVKQVMPDAADSLVLGYSEENLRRTYNSQQEIWSYFVASKLLYEKNDLKKRKFIEERPFTSEIGQKVPGAIARWVGWRIVNRFVEKKPEMTLPELMQIDNAGRILQESGYKGEPDEEE